MNRTATTSGLLFLAWAGLSLLWSPAPLEGGVLLALLALGYTLGQWCGDLRRVWSPFCIAASLNLPIAFTQWWLWWDGGDYRWYGLAGSSGRLGCVMAICFAAALAYRIWWFLPVGVFGLLYSGSRNAMLAAGVACMLTLWRDYRATAMCLALLSALAALALRDDAGASFLSRLGVWQDTLNHLTLWGHGFGSFAEEYAKWPTHTGQYQLALHAYNDFLEQIFDLGLGAAFAWVAVIAAWERHSPPDKLIIVTFGILALGFFPLWCVGPAFALSLGHLAAQGERPWRAGVSLLRTT